MAYEIKTKRVELDGGEWAEFYQELRHGTQRAINEIVRPLLKTTQGGAAVAKFTAAEGEGQVPKVEEPKELVVDMAQVDYTAVNELTILGQVKAWSFGDKVDRPTLDGLPDTIFEALVEVANQLYGNAGPLPSGGGGK